MQQACESGDLDGVRALVAQGESLHAISATARTTLTIAASSGNVELVAYLLDAGLAIDAVDFWHASALCEASARDHVEVVRLLMARGADWRISTEGGHAPVHLAAQTSSTRVLRALIELVPGIASERNRHRATALHGAAAFEALDSIAILIDAGCPIDAVDGDWTTALHRAAELGRLQACAALLEHGALADIADREEGNTAVHRLSRTPGGIALIERFKLPLDTRDKSGCTALHRCASAGLLDSVHALIRMGARLDVRDGSGRLALHSAVAFDRLDVMLALYDETRRRHPRLSLAHRKTPLEVYVRRAGGEQMAAALQAAQARHALKESVQRSRPAAGREHRGGA